MKREAYKLQYFMPDKNKTVTGNTLEEIVKAVRYSGPYDHNQTFEEYCQQVVSGIRC